MWNLFFWLLVISMMIVMSIGVSILMADLRDWLNRWYVDRYRTDYANEDYETLLWIASRSSDNIILRRLSNIDDNEMRKFLASNPALPADIIEFLYLSGNNQIRGILLNNKNSAVRAIALTFAEKSLGQYPESKNYKDVWY